MSRGEARRGEARRVVVDAIEGGRSEGVTAGEMF